MERPLDQTDWQIIAELQHDGRLSYNQLGRLVHLSAPATAERVRRLEDAGVITGYHARVDPARAGSPLTAFFQLRCRPDSCLLKTTNADELPEVTEIHRLSGNWCTMVKVRVAGIPHLEGLIERLGKHGEMNSHIVLSTQFDGRPVQPPSAGTRTVTPSPGWHR